LPACDRGVLRREVEPDRSHHSSSRFSARESAVLASFAAIDAPYVSACDGPKLPLQAHSSCPASAFRDCSADAGLDERVKAVHDETGKRRAYFWASSENGARQTKLHSSGFRGTAEPWPSRRGSIFRHDARFGCIGILCCTAARSRRLAGLRPALRDYGTRASRSSLIDWIFCLERALRQRGRSTHCYEMVV
jgi:hypothetical protein